MEQACITSVAASVAAALGIEAPAKAGPADPRILFELPHEERLPSALELLGIDPTNLAEQAGHA